MNQKKLNGRKVWTEEEDQILKYLRQEKGQKKWSVIARKMEQDFNIIGRTGKQCRQRYHNHLDSSIRVSEWKAEQEQILFDLHEEVGNKWSIISKNLPGRSDNCVKNHFYSKLRKAVRNLNKFISQKIDKQYSQIKPALLYKIIEIAESKHKQNSKIDQEIIEFCISIENKLFNFEKTEETFLNQGEYSNPYSFIQLIQNIKSLEANIKSGLKKSIRRRTNSVQDIYFLHPSLCLRTENTHLRNQHATISQASELSEVGSFNESISFTSEYDWEESEEGNRKIKFKAKSKYESTQANSIVASSSKDHFSFHGSDIAEEDYQFKQDEFSDEMHSQNLKIPIIQKSYSEQLFMEQNLIQNSPSKYPFNDVFYQQSNFTMRISTPKYANFEEKVEFQDLFEKNYSNENMEEQN